jgi:hypothetical protein
LDYWLPTGEEFKIITSAPDVSRADNGALATAAKTIVEAFAVMKTNGWIDNETAIRLAFQFAGEVLTDEKIEQILEEAKDGTEGRGDGETRSGASGNAVAGRGATEGLYSVAVVGPTWYD